MTDDRRAFLKKVAKGSLYAVPVIRTVATPPELAALAAQQASMKGMGNDNMGGGGNFVAPAGAGGPGPTSSAPWAKPPGG
jgi:hypothetical protein